MPQLQLHRLKTNAFFLVLNLQMFFLCMYGSEILLSALMINCYWEMLYQFYCKFSSLSSGERIWKDWLRFYKVTIRSSVASA